MKSKDKPKIVKVRSPKGAPFWERDPDHPAGEVWVAGHAGQPSGEVKVALTPAVEAALRQGRLELVGKAPAMEATEEEPSEGPEEPAAKKPAKGK